MGSNIPSERTLRRALSPLYDTKLQELQAKVKGRKIWVSFDETTDTQKRCIANFVFGILGDESERGNCYLANIAVLEKGDASGIAKFFNDSMQLIYPAGK